MHVAEHGLGLVELALTLEIERQIVEVFHQMIIERTATELVEGCVELPLPLIGQTEHAVGFGRFKFGFFLAALGKKEVLGGQQQMAEQQ